MHAARWVDAGGGGSQPAAAFRKWAELWVYQLLVTADEHSAARALLAKFNYSRASTPTIVAK